MYVCQNYFRKPWRDIESSYYAYPVYLHEIQVKFVYKGHRLKFKVTEAKGPISVLLECKISIRSAITPTHKTIVCM